MLILLLSLLATCFAQFQLVTDAREVKNGTCVSTLTEPIQCESILRALTARSYHGPIGNNTLQNLICSESCGNSLATWILDLMSVCNVTEKSTVLPAFITANRIWLTYNETCLKAADGSYCTEHVNSTVCSSCTIDRYRTLQSTYWSGYDADSAADFRQLQANCSVSFPSDPMPLPDFLKTTRDDRPCASKQYHQVMPGETCNTIAETNSVAVAALRLVNGIYNCDSGGVNGTRLCLPNQCQIHCVQQNDTCWSIADSFGKTAAMILAYNPGLNCNRLTVGDAICVSPSTSMYTPIVTNNTDDGSGYASTTVPAPSPVASGTTEQCGKYYKAQSGDYCQKVALNNHITVQLFEQINPSIDAGCSNLLLGTFYCVSPTRLWDLASNRTSP